MALINEELPESFDVPQPDTADAADATGAGAPEGRGAKWLLPVYAATIFLGAFLLFQVQPLISKAILPWFGGTPNVWTTCMLFFQVMLFAGYAYAHVVTTRCGPRAQGVVHCVLIAGAVVLLPILPAAAWKPDGQSDPTMTILLLLLAHVGLPYFMLAATSPLIQVWWDRSAMSGSPYRLYALSNAGSLLALVSYPFLFEPILATSVQGIGWSVAFAVFAVLLIVGGSAVWWPRRGASGNPVAKNVGGCVADTAAGQEDAPPVTWLQRFLWIGLAATGSVLLLATTNHISHDIAVVPLLWVAPLSLYLLTFIVCFSGWRYPRWTFVLAMFATTALIALDQAGTLLWIGEKFDISVPQLSGVSDHFIAALLVYLLAMFSACMVCHGELARLKPAPQRLTSFYLYVAFGGALGGIAVAIGGPLLLSGYHELSLGMLACWYLLIIVYFIDEDGWLYGGRPFWAWAVLGVGFCAFGFALMQHTMYREPNQVAVSRNFYGVLSVNENSKQLPYNHHRELVNGLILHGVQYTHAELRRSPTTYFTEQSGVGMAMQHTASRPNRRVGVVGLGVGTLAAYGAVGEAFRFYDIDPDVVAFAREHFTYLADCEASQVVVMGDARISLERELEATGPHRFDVLVLDAFSSDAIPAHLLTREAVQVYLRHLVDRPERQGIIAVHVSNRYLDLVPVVESLASHYGLDMLIVNTGDDDETLAYGANWILLSRRGGLAGIEAWNPGAGVFAPTAQEAVWTDNYTNILGLLKFD